MKQLSTWAAPVAVSLLLHAALIVLVTQQPSASYTEPIRGQTITVTMLEQITASESKPHIQAIKPVRETARPVPAPIVNPVPQESQATVATTQQASPANHETGSATASKETGLTIQPLNKLSRPPAFLHKIEPAYPAAEQRAGSQANVLAEVTIDEYGKVREVKIVKSAGKHFDAAVMDALKRSVFEPGYIDKEAVAVRVFVPFRFKLN